MSQVPGFEGRITIKELLFRNSSLTSTTHTSTAIFLMVREAFKHWPARLKCLVTFPGSSRRKPNRPYMSISQNWRSNSRRFQTFLKDFRGLTNRLKTGMTVFSTGTSMTHKKWVFDMIPQKSMQNSRVWNLTQEATLLNFSSGMRALSNLTLNLRMKISSRLKNSSTNAGTSSNTGKTQLRRNLLKPQRSCKFIRSSPSVSSIGTIVRTVPIKRKKGMNKVMCTLKLEPLRMWRRVALSIHTLKPLQTHQERNITLRRQVLLHGWPDYLNPRSRKLPFHQTSGSKNFLRTLWIISTWIFS